MTTSTTHHWNSPARNCQNCVHCKKSATGFDFDRCKRFQTFCEFAVTRPLCGYELRFWQPRPPRRSLRRWLIDLIWT